MKYLSISLAFLAVAIVNAEDGGNAINKVSDNRWFQNQLFKSQPSFLEALFSTNSKPSSPERATNERTFKDFLAYEAIQSILLNALRPKPIVDTASESEKNAPNYGSQVAALGNFVVKGTETLSKALNSFVDVPKQAAKKLSAGATQALNQLGAYIIGL